MSDISVAVVSCGPAMWRNLMPVRSTIHSSVVSMPTPANSWFVNTVAGMPRPVPAM